MQWMTRNPSLIVASAAVLLAACANNAQTGAAVGAAGGAVAGGIIGNAAGSTTKGVIIGAVVGGAAGAIIGHEMDKQAKELEQNIKGAKVERVGEGIHVTFDSGLLYDFDSDVVKPAAQDNLHELAKSLDKYPNSDLLIAGYTDQVGDASYNLDLSQRRAASAPGSLSAARAPPIERRQDRTCQPSYSSVPSGATKARARPPTCSGPGSTTW